MDIVAIKKALAELLTIEDITSAHASLRTICDVATAISCQPRHFDDETKQATRSGLVIEAFCEFLNAETDNLVRRIEAAKPETAWDRHLAHGLLIEHEATCGTDAAKIANIAANLAATTH